MADEITMSFYLTITNGDFSDVINPGSIQIDQSAKGWYAAIVNVGTTEEDLAFGDLSVPGLCYLRNLDATNYVKFGPKDTTMKLLGKLLPSEFAFFRFGASVTLRWQADTAACLVETRVYET